MTLVTQRTLSTKDRASLGKNSAETGSFARAGNAKTALAPLLGVFGHGFAHILNQRVLWLAAKPIQLTESVDIGEAEGLYSLRPCSWRRLEQTESAGPF